jgi:hypothetical protein
MDQSGAHIAIHMSEDHITCYCGICISTLAVNFMFSFGLHRIQTI